MLCGALHKSCQSCPWGRKWPHPGVFSSHILKMGKLKKSSSLKPQCPELLYFECSNVRLVILSINPAKSIQVIHGGLFICHRLIQRNTRISSSLKPQDPKRVYLVCNEVMVLYILSMIPLGFKMTQHRGTLAPIKYLR